jgi:hypothetical protein
MQYSEGHFSGPDCTLEKAQEAKLVGSEFRDGRFDCVEVVFAKRGG